MSEQQIVAYNFKRLREERGWTQDQLAAMRRVSQNYIAQIEGNHCDFGARARKKWANTFGVDATEFFKLPRDSYKINPAFNTVREKINIILDDIDEEAQRAILKYSEDQKLIIGLKKKKAG